ncbi:MAG: TIGR02449 family protein [Wenzhouxiangella sp.]|jgi:cell division protein ZapB|nr:TIGR02449 family protein [Wenzhouxiangella sp.]
MSSLSQSEADLDRLEQGLKEMVRRLRVLEEENRSLKARQDNLVSERAVLVQRNEEARSRVEAMIERLKALESAN